MSLLKTASFFFLLLLSLAGFYIFHAGMNLLHSSSIPSDIDVVVTFAPIEIRYEYSRELREEYDSHWIIGDPGHLVSRKAIIGEADYNNATLITDSYSTYSEIVEIRKILDNISIAENNISIALVSSHFHMRRIKMLTERYLNSANFNIHYLPVPDDMYEPYLKSSAYESWWKHKDLQIEAFKNLLYELRVYRVYTHTRKLKKILRAYLSS
jgi:hypothetical protein